MPAAQAAPSLQEEQPVMEVQPQQSTDESVEAPIQVNEEVTVIPTKWQDNPNKCNTDSHYIAKEAPYNCIAKPVATTPTRVASVASGDWVTQCKAWAAQVGISLPSAAITLIGRESKCNPTICNPNGVACGIPQALPWTKMGCSLSATDAGCQLKWMQSYVMGRYGSWEAALSHSYTHNWY